MSGIDLFKNYNMTLSDIHKKRYPINKPVQVPDDKKSRLSVKRKIILATSLFLITTSILAITIKHMKKKDNLEGDFVINNITSNISSVDIGIILPISSYKVIDNLSFNYTYRVSNQTDIANISQYVASINNTSKNSSNNLKYDIYSIKYINLSSENVNLLKKIFDTHNITYNIYKNEKVYWGVYKGSDPKSSNLILIDKFPVKEQAIDYADNLGVDIVIKPILGDIYYIEGCCTNLSTSETIKNSNNFKDNMIINRI